MPLLWKSRQDNPSAFVNRKSRIQNMLFIHKLSDLSIRSAQSESIPLIRSFRKQLSFPVGDLSPLFRECMISDNEISQMNSGLDSVGIMMEKARSLLREKAGIHEPINLNRLIQSLELVPQLLEANIAFAKEMQEWRPQLLKEIEAIINTLPFLRTAEQKNAANEKISTIFSRLLRNPEFKFNYAGLIHEGHVEMSTGLASGMEKGYIFHIALEEEIHKVPFSVIKQRMPEDK